MTDCELIELAAKAAEMKASSDGTIYAGFGSREWNPITDDGDALRLSAKLSIDVLHRYVGGQRVEALAPGGSAKVEYCDSETRPAATRRAIVLAAASAAPQE